MPQRRRGKAAAARAAAIQAVKKRQQQQEDFHFDQDDDDDDDDDDNDSPPPLESDDSGGCLHCHRNCTNIQVRCDECQAYICQDCHWCHEFQANHEVRVCDRCDAFYCRTCDEMDQCDDCGEVVCASCSTLLSCKFCGGGLCEECATACGRCGIVLCSRDAKFAVDCDTCRLSYCLVCLASGSKDPCVRCGHRPSKRMEQLVHLRLKSIYKAFKQSSRSSSSSSCRLEHDDDDDDIEEDPQVLLKVAASAASAAKPKAAAASQAREMVDKYMAEKEKADAAAAALLAELEEEEEQQKTKKSKKKRKKERQQAKREEERKKADDQDIPKQDRKVPPTDPPAESFLKQKPPEKKRNKKTEHKVAEDEDSPDEDPPPMETFPDEDPPSLKPRFPNKESPPLKASCTAQITPPPPEQENLEEDLAETEREVEAVEKQIWDLVAEGNIGGIEEILLSLKGVPGRAALRKNAKKALKRLKAKKEEEDAKEAESRESRSKSPSGNCLAARGTPSTNAVERGVDCPEGLIKIVSKTDNLHGSALNTAHSHHRVGDAKSECVMHMAPTVVGWVIGRGGQRIRDLMDDSGAKIWIDQDGMGSQDPRVVYVSGDRSCVDSAVKMIKELVSKAPVGESGCITKTASHLSKRNGNSCTDTDSKNLVPNELKNRKGHGSKAASPAPRSTKNPTEQTETKQKVPIVIHEMTCEPRFVPLLIGRRGWTIKHIQDSSGARVDIDQTVSPRRIKISGKNDSVQSAIRMVRDVLSYPHAQLQGTRKEEKATVTEKTEKTAQSAQPQVTKKEEKAPVTEKNYSKDLQQKNEPVEPTPKEKSVSSGPQVVSATTRNSPENDEAVERIHSPPPSSLIMTGDAKSTISASSSLSSTPEPSMASSSKGYYRQSSGGPALPFDYGQPFAPSAFHHLPEVNQALHPEQSGTSFYSNRFMGMRHSQPFGSPPQPPMGVQSNQHPVPVGLPVLNQGPGLGGFAPKSMGQIPSSTTPPDPNGLQYANAVDFASLGGQPVPAPAPAPFQPPGAFDRSQSRPAESMLPTFLNSNKIRNGNGGSAFESPLGLWGGNPTVGLNEPPGVEGCPNPTDMQGRSDSLDDGDLAGSFSLPQKVCEDGIGSPLGTPKSKTLNVVPNGGDDSQMVDSLFAPVGEGENLLKGFQGLSINAGALGTGVWAPADPVWNSLNQKVTDTNPTEPNLFPTMATTQQQQHPPKSRFGWGSTNESMEQAL